MFGLSLQRLEFESPQGVRQPAEIVRAHAFENGIRMARRCRAERTSRVEGLHGRREVALDRYAARDENSVLVAA